DTNSKLVHMTQAHPDLTDGGSATTAIQSIPLNPIRIVTNHKHASPTPMRTDSPTIGGYSCPARRPPTARPTSAPAPETIKQKTIGTTNSHSRDRSTNAVPSTTTPVATRSAGMW